MTTTTRTMVVSVAISAAVGIALGLTFILIGLQGSQALPMPHGF